MITTLMLYVCLDAFHTDCQVYGVKSWEEDNPGQCRAAALILQTQEERKRENKGKYVFTTCEPEPGAYKQSGAALVTERFVL